MHEEDLACHARFGRTKRAEMLYGPPGHAYVFLIYGMYDCFNVVCEPKDSPAAVLVRALEPVPPLARRHRRAGQAVPRARASPARTTAPTSCAARRCGSSSASGPRVRVATTPRIGVDYAGEWAKKPWRFVDADSRWLSKKLK